MIIAIDGPSASGKSTVAQLLATRLGFGYMDTGAMYRALTWKVLQDEVDLSNEGELAKVAKDTRIEFKPPATTSPKVFVDGTDVTEAIRSPQIGSRVSLVSRASGVRREMVKRQRRLCKDKCVVEGRDVGSVVFPQADLKIFLTASAAERARRRKDELSERGHAVELDSVRQELLGRDQIDSERQVGPLKVPPGAHTIDTTERTPMEVVEEILTLARAEHRLPAR